MYEYLARFSFHESTNVCSNLGRIVFNKCMNVKDVNGRLLRGNEVRKRWAEYFEELLNVQEDREADIVAVGGVQVPVMGEENEREITIEEVKMALNETK